MLERYGHHPRLMDEAGWQQLPPSRWHSKITDRYPIGSPVELRRRRDGFFYKGLALARGDTEHVNLFYMQPLPELLDVVDDPIDIVGCTLVDQQKQQAILLLENHITDDDSPYTFGKSTVTRKLAGLKPIDKLLRTALDISTNEKISAWELFNKLVRKDMIVDSQEQQTGLQMLTADITYVARSCNGQLMVMAIMGTKEDCIWDTTRNAMRYLIEKRDFTSTMAAKVELARKLMIDGNAWAEIDRMYQIREVIFLTPDPSLVEKVEWGETITGGNNSLNYLQEQLLRNPLYLSGRTKYWVVDPGQHGEIVERLFGKEFAELPTVRHLHIKNPKDREILGLAAEAIKQVVL